MKANLGWEITLPTYFTLARFCLIPCILVAITKQSWGLATLFFVGASLTDVIDGKLARSRNVVSKLGTLLDPLVDKVMLISVYASLVFSNVLTIGLPMWFLVLALLHEAFLLAGAAYWSLFRESIVIAPSHLAKLVGLGQFLFISWALTCALLGYTPVGLFYLLVVIIALARLCVLAQYGQQTYRVVS